MTFLELAEEVLKTVGRPLTYTEIWKNAKSKGLDKQVSTKGKTPEETLRVSISTDIKKKNDSSIFLIYSKKPTTFWLKDIKNGLANTVIQAQIPQIQNKTTFHERDLHPLLVKFLYESDDFDLYCKTIYYEKSHKGIKGEDKWNYPDIVGIHFPFDDYKKETFDLVKNFNKQNCKIYSFELKKSISWIYLKEYYFQAVSNSSWANEGYLVIFENIETEILSELIRLNASFGIGIIQLDIETSNSKIILPSKQRDLDIQTIDMLVDKNKNFRAFIEDINKDINAHDKFRIAKDRYDKILDDNELDKYIKDKHISKEE